VHFGTHNTATGGAKVPVPGYRNGFPHPIYPSNLSVCFFFLNHNNHLIKTIVTGAFPSTSSPSTPNNTTVRHFVIDEMDPNQQKKKGSKDKFDFAVHSERSHQVATEARAEWGSGHNLNPPRNVFPASNANMLARGPYPPAVTAPSVQAPMEVVLKVILHI
jgi:hypothetical protein